jgi:hypothetical protein
MTDAGGSAVPAGWYNDPAGSGHLRWWDGTAWSAHLAPRPAPAAVSVPAAAPLPVAEPYVPFQGSWNARADTGHNASAIEFARPMQWNTAGAWLLAFSQLIYLVLVVVFAVVDASAISAPFGSGANNLLLSGTVAVQIGLWVLLLLFAAMDRRKLRSLGYLRTASIWWILVIPFTPLLYLVMRGIAVSREVGRGFGPLVAYIVSYVVIVLLGVGAAVAIPLYLAQEGGVSSAAFAAGIQKGLDGSGAQFTVTCPPSIPTTIGQSFTCTAVDAAGTSHALKISIVAGADGKPAPKLLSVSPPIAG